MFTRFSPRSTPKRSKMLVFASETPALGKLMPDLSEFMTVQDAALKLGFHVNHVRRMRREGDLTGIKFGASWFITKKSVEEYIEKTAGLEKFDPRRKIEK